MFPIGVVGDDPKEIKNNPDTRFQEIAFVDIILTNERYGYKSEEKVIGR